MTELEIQDVFVKQLTVKEIQRALVDSYYILSHKILAKIAKDKEHLLHDNAFAKSCLCFFLGLGPLSRNCIVKISEANLENLLFIYRQWLQALIYLEDNYLTIDSPRLKRLWSQKQLGQFGKIVKEILADYEKQFYKNKFVEFRVKELPIADDVFNLFYAAILGEDLFQKFSEEFNQSVAILRKFQKELKAETSTK